jgi:A nuclease family of the HNH/ENDO VII superfamily with conserved AHH
VSGAGRVLARTGRVGASVVRAIGTGSRYVLRTAGAVIARGKLMLQGLKGSMGQGIRTLEELGERLLARLRFRRFRIVREDRILILEGYINPWIPIGTIPMYFSQEELRLATGSSANKTFRLGERVTINGERTLVVGAHGSPSGIATGIEDASEFVHDLANATPAERAAILNRLNNPALSQSQIIAIIRQRESTAALRSAIPARLQRPYFQAHHIFPRELSRTFDDFFRAIGFDIENGVRNGIMIPPNQIIRDAEVLANPNLALRYGNSAFHLGSHPNYTRQVAVYLEGIRAQLNSGTITVAMANSLVNDLSTYLRRTIRTGGNVAIDQLIF